MNDLAVLAALGFGYSGSFGFNNYWKTCFDKPISSLPRCTDSSIFDSLPDLAVFVAFGKSDIFRHFNRFDISENFKILARFEVCLRNFLFLSVLMLHRLYFSV